MLCLITGGAGFIGSHLAEFLLNDGHHVIILDDFSTGFRHNIAHIRNRLTLVTGDIRTKGVINTLMDGVDVVFHLAAIPRVPLSIDDPWRTNSVNVDGTLSVLLAARDNKVRRFVFASSSSVYGADNETPYRESMRPNPLSPYALQKLTGEFYCKQFSELYELETVVVRYFNVYGPRQSAESQYSAVIPKFIKAIKAGEPPNIFGDGLQSRAFVHVTDAAAATAKLACTPSSQIYEAGGIFNIAGPEQCTVNTLTTMLIEMLSSDVVPRHLEERAGDLKHSFADMTALETATGYVPKTKLSEGLKQLI